jgi:hypothetical protein
MRFDPCRSSAAHPLLSFTRSRIAPLHLTPHGTNYLALLPVSANEIFPARLHSLAPLIVHDLASHLSYRQQRGHLTCRIPKTRNMELPVSANPESSDAE